MITKFTTYDLEVIENFFSADFKNHETGAKKLFIIHEDVNDLDALYKFLRQLERHDWYLVGFNNIGYDAQILEYILKHYSHLKSLDSRTITEKLHDLSSRIINLQPEERWQNLVAEWNLSIPQIDLYKQRHYDAMGKRTSLKWLQFTMRFPNIETMPISHTAIVTKEQVPSIIKYNDNDVNSTDEFFKLIKFETELRYELSNEYNLNLLSASEPKLARDIFGKFLSDEMGMPYRDLKELRTYRSYLKAKDVLFKYINFEDPLLQGAKDFYQKLEFNPYDFKQNNLGLKKVQKTFKYYTLPEVVIGLGGIHACVNPGVYNARPDHVIRDIDGKSYYPNLGIKNELFPEHLSKAFCVVYESLYDMRTKIPKENPVNYIFKIILNAAYGLSKEPNNYFHDPKYTFAITINGQLLLLKLAELIKQSVKDVVFYQFNTDGISIGYNPKDTPKIDKAIKEWEKLTKIKTEDNFYSKMIIRNVNNYIAVSIDGKIKRKGDSFGYSMNPEDKEMDYHKNPGGLIVQKALEQYFVYGKDYKDYILNSKDIYDFCFGVKLTKDFTVERQYFDKDKNAIVKEPINQTVIRYYVSNEPSKLKKKYKNGTKKAGQTVEFEANDKESKIHSVVNTTYYNVHVEKPMKDYNINYSYYIKEARKVINDIEPNVSNLKMEL